MTNKTIFSGLMLLVLALGFSCGKTGTGNTDTSTGTDTTTGTGTETGNPNVLLKGLFVDAESEVDDPDGSSWNMAFKTVQEAINAVVNDNAELKNIYVAAGTYENPGITINGKKKIRLIGGYEPSDIHEKVRTKATIFNGGADGKSLVVVEAGSEDISFDGITFQNTLNASALNLNGGKDIGVYNCQFLKNKKVTKNAKHELIGYGAGIEINDVSGVKIENCKFENNVVSADGGAIQIWAVAQFVEIEKTSFDANTAYNGGAISFYGHSEDSKLTLGAGLKFNGNVSTQDNGGGAIYAEFNIDKKNNQLVFTSLIEQSDNKSDNNAGKFMRIGFEKAAKVDQTELSQFITVGESGIKLEKDADGLVFFE